jgi:hypothetical protein
MKNIIKSLAIIGFIGCVALITIAAIDKQDQQKQEEWKAKFLNDRLLFSSTGVLNFVWQ